MKYFSKEYRLFSMKEIWVAFFIFSSSFLIFIRYYEMNKEDDCIEYAKFIESDYKYDSDYGCYVKRNNIWISKSESQFR